MSSTTKIPCGGFYLGGGFGINENTLVCNNYLKINQTTIIEDEGFKFSYEISPDSPLKNVEDVLQQIENGSIFVLISKNGSPVTLFAPNSVNILRVVEPESFTIILSRMYVLGKLSKSQLVEESYILKSDDSITVSSQSFTLTKES